jgi:hypothetical protein
MGSASPLPSPVHDCLKIHPCCFFQIWSALRTSLIYLSFGQLIQSCSHLPGGGPAGSLSVGGSSSAPAPSTRSGISLFDPLVEVTKLAVDRSTDLTGCARAKAIAESGFWPRAITFRGFELISVDSRIDPSAITASATCSHGSGRALWGGWVTGLKISSYSSESPLVEIDGRIFNQRVPSRNGCISDSCPSIAW